MPLTGLGFAQAIEMLFPAKLPGIVGRELDGAKTHYAGARTKFGRICGRCFQHAEAVGLAELLEFPEDRTVAPFHQPRVFRAAASLRGEVAVEIFEHDEIHRLATRNSLVFAVNVLRGALRCTIRIVRAQPDAERLREYEVSGLIHALLLQRFKPVEQLRTGIGQLDPSLVPSEPGRHAGRLLQGAIERLTALTQRLELLDARKRKPTLAREEFLARKYAPNPFFSAGETAEASRGDCDPYLEGPSTDCFVIRQGQRRWTLTGPLSMAGHCEVVNPGASLAILTLMLGSLPESARLYSRWYRRFLCTYHPELFRSIPWQKTGRRLAESRPLRMYYRIDSAIRQRLGHYRHPRPFFDYGRAVAACRLRAKLGEGDLMVDDVLHGAVRRTLRSETSMSAKTLLGVVTLETYLRQTGGRPSLTLV